MLLFPFSGLYGMQRACVRMCVSLFGSKYVSSPLSFHQIAFNVHRIEATTLNLMKNRFARFLQERKRQRERERARKTKFRKI